MLRFLLGDRKTLLCTFGVVAGFFMAAVMAVAQQTPGNPAASQGSQSQSTQPQATQSQPALETRAQDPGPKLSITTHEVLLDVLVTDASNHPVTGLTSADFTVTEEGAPQTLKRLREHQPMGAAEVARLNKMPALPPNTFTNFTPEVNTNAATVILLDALNTPVTAQMYLREQLIDYLKKMQPGATIAIFQLDTGMHLIQGFSSDPQALLAAAKSKRDMPSLQRPIHGTGDTYFRVKREILRDGLRMIGRYLAGFPGRKNLIWFTGEVPLTIYGGGIGNPFRDSFNVRDEGQRDEYLTGDTLTDMVDVLTVSRVAVYPVDTRGLQIDPQYDASRGGSGGVHASMRFASRQAFDHFNLDTVATATGGKAYYNTNGLSETIAEVVNNGSNYYTLSYSTTNKEWKGQFRRIKITVNRPGVTLQHRQGYYAINREAQEQRQLAALQKRKAKAAAAPPPNGEIPDSDDEPREPDESGALIKHPNNGGFAASMALGAVPPTELAFVASVTAEDKVEKLDKKAPLPQGNFLRAPYQGKPFRTYTIVVKADAHRFKLTKTEDGIRHGTVEFVAVLYDPTGETVNSLLSTASFDMREATYRAMLQKGAIVTEKIAVPVKGNYFLRLGVHDVGGDQVGALEIPVDQVQMGVAGPGSATH